VAYRNQIVSVSLILVGRPILAAACFQQALAGSAKSRLKKRLQAE
jgi:hypothetical protein